jgi:molecular chaperone DnaK (HSP70)
LFILGEWKVNEVKPSPTGEAQEVKVKVRINHNGILLISSAQMIEKKEANEEQQNAENEQPQSPTEPNPEGTPGTEPMETQEAVSVPLLSHVLCRTNHLPVRLIYPSPKQI